MGLMPLIIGCIDSKKQHKDTEAGIKHNHKNSTETHSQKQHTGDANKHMHQSSTAELIKRFESKERDAYQKPEEVLNYLGDLSDKTIIDIGAGSGYFSVKLAQKAKKVISADVDQEFLSYIENRIDKNAIKNIELRKIPYDHAALKAKEVDMIFIVNTYHHIENRKNYFEVARKGLKDNGELVIIDFFKTESPVGPPLEMKIAYNDVIAELRKVGYTNFGVEKDLLPYQYIIKAKKIRFPAYGILQ
jgi:cyclopropane fatty-acyl-phospholipid synthase-like methyltransferase